MNIAANHTADESAGNVVPLVHADRNSVGEQTLLKLAHLSLMPQAIASRLAVSESGFVFDPVSGQSYTVNESGLAILRLAQSGADLPHILREMDARYEGSAEEIKRDVQDFADSLKECFK